MQELKGQTTFYLQLMRGACLYAKKIHRKKTIMPIKPLNIIDENSYLLHRIIDNFSRILKLTVIVFSLILIILTGNSPGLTK